MALLAKVCLQLCLLCFFLGGVAAIIPSRFQKTANYYAHGAALLGGLAGGIAALAVLLTGHGFVLSGWRIAGELTIAFASNTLGAFFLLIISVVAIGVSLYSMGYVTEYYGKKNIGFLSGGLCLFFAAMVAVVVSDNGVTFLIFWELMSLVSFLLVIFENEHPEVLQAGFIYLVMTHIGTAFIIIAFLFLFQYTGSFSFVVWGQLAQTMPAGLKDAVFLLALLGFGTKAGIVPLHIWLPRAHPVAPSNISAVMSAVMLKMAVYGLLLTGFVFFKGGPAWWGIVLLIAGIASALIGILYGLAENNLKSFLAYSSVENMGVIFCGIGAALIFSAHQLSFAAALAMTAVLFFSLNHALFKSLLFMGAGAVKTAAGTLDINQLGGLQKKMPLVALLFLLGGLALAALPPTNGFISEWAMLQTMLHLSFDLPGPWWQVGGIILAALLLIVGVMVAGGVVKNYGIAFLALPRNPELAAKPYKLPALLKAGMLFPALLIVGLGIFPDLMLFVINDICEAFFANHMAEGYLWLLPAADGPASASFPKILLLGGLFALLLVAVFVLVRQCFGQGRPRVAATWNCGTPLTPGMQYNGTSFSHPVLKIFRFFTGNHRIVEFETGLEYFPEKIPHRISSNHYIEDLLYKPAVAATLRLSGWIKLVQNGSLQSYLAYMVIALIIALLWIRQV